MTELNVNDTADDYNVIENKWIGSEKETNETRKPKLRDH